MGLANVLAGLVVTLLGLGVTLSASKLAYHAEYGPGPGFLPLWIGLGLTACGAITLAGALRRFRRETEPFSGPLTRKVAFVFSSLVVTFLLLPVLGLTVALSLFTGFTARAAGRHGWGVCLLLAVATGVTIRAVFGYALDIPLPKGLLGL